MMRKNKSLLLDKIHHIDLDEQLSLEPDTLTEGAQRRLGEEKEKIETEYLKTNLANLKEAFSLSNRLSKGIFTLVVVWVIALFVFLIYQTNLPPALRLHDSVLITLLSTTTVNILGLLLLVIKYVFNHRLKM